MLICLLIIVSTIVTCLLSLMAVLLILLSIAHQFRATRQGLGPMYPILCCVLTSRNTFCRCVIQFAEYYDLSLRSDGKFCYGTIFTYQITPTWNDVIHRRHVDSDVCRRSMPSSALIDRQSVYSVFQLAWSDERIKTSSPLYLLAITGRR